MQRIHLTGLCAFFFCLGVLPAQPTLTFLPGSSIKLEQLNGDCDWGLLDLTATCLATTSQTITRFSVLGNDLGYSLEHNGNLVLLFGDTIGQDASTGQPVAFGARDPMAWATNSSGESPLLITYYTNPDGSLLWVAPTPQPKGAQPTGIANGAKISMAADDVPNSGIDLNGQLYIAVNVNADTSLDDPHLKAYSVLVEFDDAKQTFTSGRTLSQSYYPLPTAPPASGTPGHFVFPAFAAPAQKFGDLPVNAVFIFGTGQYRASSPYLSYIPQASFWGGTDSKGKNVTQYFTGLDAKGRPTWSNQESDAVPVFLDNPTNLPATPDPGTVGNLTVDYRADLGLWLMIYDGGRQSNATKGVYFATATAPWGPWSTPQLIFNPCREGGWGVFINYYYDAAHPAQNVCPAAPGFGPAGPAIGSNDPVTTRGDVYAPSMIARFTQVDGNTLSLYYNMSTWNPYAIVKMRSQFLIAPSAVAGPAASLTAGAQHNRTVVAGTTLNFAWSSLNAVSATSTVSADSGAPSPFTINTVAGAMQVPTDPTMPGHVYVYTFTVTDAAGNSASDQVTVTVAPLPTATLTANGSHSLTAATGSTVNFAWTSTNGISAASTVALDGGTPAPWLAADLNDQASVTLASNQAGHTYVYTYTVTDALGQTGSDQVTLTVTAAPIPTIVSFSVGPDETVTYPNSANASPYLVDLPDEHVSFLPPAGGSGKYLLFAASKVSGGTGGAVVLETTDLLTFTFAADLGYKDQVMAPPLQITQCNKSYDTEFDEGYAAPGSVVQDPTMPAGNLIMLYEAENHCPGGVNQQPFYASVGFARSSDNGRTWPAPENGPSGGPGRFPVLQSSDPQPTAPHGPLGNAIPSAFVDTGADGNFYLYVTYLYRGTAETGGIRVARAQLGQQPLTFLKWYQGSFSQPGIGGSDSPIPGGSGTCAVSGGAHSEIDYNDALGLYLLTYVCISGPNSARVGAWYYSTATSLDLQDWSAPQMIQNSQSPVSSPCNADGTSGSEFDGWYPSFMSPGAAAGHTALTGRAYFLNGCETGARKFMSRAFTITTATQ